MHSIVRICRFGALACALFTGACTSTPPTMRGGARVERVDKEFDIAEGVTRIAIDNPWGEINVRGQDEREVGIHAVIQHLPPRFPRVEFRSRRDGDTFRIDVIVNGATPGDEPKPARADIAVYVPGDLALALSSRDGRIAAKRRAGPIEATTDSGEIHASSLGRLQLRSRSGQIRAIAIGRRWQGESDIATDSGRIVLLVPTFGDIALDARTRGRLTSGFGLSIHDQTDGEHEAHARYGAGTSPLHVRSTSGEIVLEQLVLLGDDTELPEDDD
ncbi:MAG TPA: hypothetical protein VHE32_13995 [Rhodanobacteraceae bacterium]|jgi:hypothetical protein|nr:hypothetical protein [Rhodanobacteraceae bacterium]